MRLVQIWIAFLFLCDILLCIPILNEEWSSNNPVTGLSPGTSDCYFRQTVKKGQLAKLKVFEYMLLQHDFLCDHFPDLSVSIFHLLCSSHIEKGWVLKGWVTQVFLYISTGIYSSKPFIVIWAGFEKSPANALKQRWMYSA